MVTPLPPPTAAVASLFHLATNTTTSSASSSSSVEVPVDYESSLYEVMSSEDEGEWFEEITIASSAYSKARQREGTRYNDNFGNDVQEEFEEITVDTLNENDETMNQGLFCPKMSSSDGHVSTQNNQNQHFNHGEVSSTPTPATRNTTLLQEQGDESGEKIVPTSIHQAATSDSTNKNLDTSTVASADDTVSYFELTLPKLQPQVSGLSCFVDLQMPEEGTEDIAHFEEAANPTKLPNNHSSKTSLSPPRTNKSPLWNTSAARNPPFKSPLRQKSTTMLSQLSPLSNNQEGFELRLLMQRQISGLTTAGLESVHEEDDSEEEVDKDEPLGALLETSPGTSDCTDVNKGDVGNQAKKSSFQSFSSPRRSEGGGRTITPKRLSTIEEGSIHHSSSVHRRTSSPSPPRGTFAKKKKKKKNIASPERKRSRSQERRMIVASSLDRFEETITSRLPVAPLLMEEPGSVRMNALQGESSNMSPSSSDSSIEDSSVEESLQDHGFDLVLQPMMRQPSALTFCAFDLADEDDDTKEYTDTIMEPILPPTLETKPMAPPKVPEASTVKKSRSSKKDRKSDKKVKKSNSSRTNKTSLASNECKSRRRSNGSKKVKRSSTVSASAVEGIKKPPRSSSARPLRHSYSSPPQLDSSTSSPRGRRSKSPSPPSSFRSPKWRSKSPSFKSPEQKQDYEGSTRSMPATLQSPSRHHRRWSSATASIRAKVSSLVQRARSQSPCRRRRSTSLSPPASPRLKRNASNSSSKGTTGSKSTKGKNKTNHLDPSPSLLPLLIATPEKDASQPPLRTKRHTFPNASNLQALSLSDHPPKKKTTKKKRNSPHRRRKSDTTTFTAPTGAIQNQNDQSLGNLGNDIVQYALDQTKEAKLVKGPSKRSKEKTAAAVTRKRSSYPTSSIMSSPDAAGWCKVVPRRSAKT